MYKDVCVRACVCPFVPAIRQQTKLGVCYICREDLRADASQQVLDEKKEGMNRIKAGKWFNSVTLGKVCVQMCVCVCGFQREISSCSYSPERVETHLWKTAAQGEKALTKQDKSKEGKGRKKNHAHHVRAF